MSVFWIMTVIALVFSCIGFKKYIWFISIGYGLAVAGIGAGLLVTGCRMASGGQALSPWIIFACILFIVYGIRLGGYLAVREWKSNSYNTKMEGEVKSGEDMNIAVKCAIWISAALLYVCETSPVLFRMINGSGTDGVFITGLVISVLGLVIESAADLQKNAAKKAAPGRFVDSGLYRLVRCPNYFGELLFWAGTFIGGVPVFQGSVQWACGLIGFLGIIYVMFGGARRLEMRQDRTYGDDPEYWAYKNSTPIMIPVIPLYSVKDHKWLVA